MYSNVHLLNACVLHKMGSTTVISAVENGSVNLLNLLLKYDPYLDHPKVLAIFSVYSCAIMTILNIPF